MDDHHLTISGELQIHLQHINAYRYGVLKRRHGAVRPLVVAAGVRDVREGLLQDWPVGLRREAGASGEAQEDQK